MPQVLIYQGGKTGIFTVSFGTLIAGREYVGTLMAKESLALLLICTADALSTYWLITNGFATEFNPIMNWVLGFGWFAFFAVKGATVALAIAFAEVYRKRNPDFVRCWTRLAIGLYLSLWTVGVLVSSFALG